MKGLGRHLTRIGAFAVKEIREVLRQPKLVLSLIVGPFLILGLFAIGYQSRPPALRTVMVFPAGSELASQADDLEEALQPFIEVVGVTQDADAAKRRLLDQEIDVVVVAPADALETIRAGEHATIEVLHTRLDPFDRANIAIFSRTSIDELNRTLLAEVARVGQERVDASDDALPAARSSAAAYSEALESGDDVDVRRAQLELDRSLLILERQLASTSQVYEGLDRGLGAENDGAFGAFSELRRNVSDIDEADPDAAERAAAVEAELEELETNLADIKRIPAEVAVQPFLPQETLATGIEIPLETYYAPAVMIVLVQHLALTFAALSVVGERTLGITSLFRIGPTTTTDIVLGKYLGYSVIAGLISTVLAVSLVFGFGVPMGGSWVWLAGIMAMVIAASLALGFVIAGFSSSDSQAVQFSMLTLLFTIFFSGFVLSLDRIVEAVRGVAFLVPATAGIAALQDVMFRGEQPRTLMLVGLGAYVLVAFVASTTILRRRFRT